MNPLQLRFAGIGSYPGEVEINFRDLNQKGLYLIVGPTGSGKTTLLDAMSYALYGAMPSERTNAIVSLHPNRSKPEIEFEFEHGDRKFVVHREPAIPGKQIVTSKQWLREIDQAGVVINTITGSRDVTDKCEEIIGLTVDEFTQVILLPQGKFQKFLMAKGSEKQAVLQTIFGTLAYRRVVESLKASADELENEVQDDQVEISNQWSNIDSNIAALADIDLGIEIPDPRSDLGATANFIQGLVEEFSNRELVAKESLLQLQADHTRASTDAKRFDDAQNLAQLRKEESRISKSVATAREKVDAHENAVPVLEAANNRDRLANEVSDQYQEIAEVRAELKREAQVLIVGPRTTKTFQDAIPTASPVQLTNEFSKLEQRLSGAKTAHGELVQLNSDIKANEIELKKNAGEVLRLAKVVTERTSDLKKLATTLKKARDKIKGLSAAERAVGALDNLLENANVKESTDALRIASTKAKEARTKFDKSERTLREALAARTKALAGSLAEDLEDGEPCPVCGSKDHPKVARSSARSSNIEAAERARDSASKSLLNAERDLKDAQKALERAQGFAKKVPSLNEQKQIRTRYESLVELSNEVDDLDNSHTELVEALDEAKELLSEAKSYSSELVTEKAALEKQKSKCESIVQSVGSQKEVLSSLKGCRDIESSLKRLETCVKQLNALEGEAKNATKSFESALAKSRFRAEKEAHQAILAKAVLTGHQSEIALFDKLKTDIMKLEASIGSDPLPKVRPRVEEIKERLSEAATTTTEISNVAGSLRASMKQISSAKLKIERISPKIEEKMSNAMKARSISTVFEKGAGGAGGQLGLEVWIQRTLFQEVCLVANTQLRTLSNNQYSLTLEQADGGVAKSHGSGLDIYVLDSYNGTTRPVQSMSGGEQFMASLSLALALAEVVQQHAGGIELPCLFIDEGFGGLDSESLDLAINVLGEIHASGRAVGIITHVEEMINRLPIGIRVFKSENGSTLQVETD